MILSDNNITKKIDSQILKKKQLNLFKYKELYDIVHLYIQKNKLLLYGGMALNSILPEKIYDENELPDYDIITNDANKHGILLADEFKKQGYKYIELKKGIHYGTYKLFVEFQPVADITDCPPSLYRKMFKNKMYSKDAKLYTVPIDYLRMALYNELSRPFSNVQRWEKVYFRLNLLNKYFTIKSQTKNIFLKKNTSNDLKNILNFIKQFLQYKKVVFFGTSAFSFFKPSAIKYPKVNKYMSYFDVLSIDAKNTIHELSLMLKNKFKIEFKIINRKGVGYTEYLPNHFSLFYKSKLLINVFQSNACYSYKNINRMRIASIETMLVMYYGFLFTNRKYLDIKKVRDMIEYLLKIQNKKGIDRLITTCYGKELQLSDMRRKKWIRTSTKERSQMTYRPKYNYLK